MYGERAIQFDNSRGPISVEVNSGYVSQGAFSLSITDGNKIIKVGDGKLGDNIPDIFLIPIPANQLEDWMLIIIGSYSPAYGHQQICVDYNFIQKGDSIHTEPIRVNQNSLAAHHDFTFKA